MIKTVFYLSSMIIAFLTFNLFACNQTSALPNFDENERYSSVRLKMLEAGWEPFLAKEADTCTEGDLRCEGRPEMQVCAGTGKANCKFLWKKEENMTAICTVGEVAVFDSVCDYL
ncbi:hypothetical protein [Methylophaga sp. UBA2689]|jgi:hypothetical protein|uniref:hypothetical protein n=1 Tax=Methylophaga sp. UBA2689 TaxID=1946878 RepID=UPI0025E3C53C|nr:hypothetical protein [Methylophaga sp. UBA2689]|tara:strand:+ start:1702 stop:2046 length:345 start_codon:yes stop_codon:yes gene_type:complete